MDRRQMLKLLGSLGVAGAAAPVLSACGSTGSSVEDLGPVKIGLMVPQKGSYKSIGEDMLNGFKLYLKLNEEKLGGRQVKLVIQHEGETPEEGKDAAQKLVKDEKVLAVSGVANSLIMENTYTTFEQQQVPLVGSNASPTTLQGVKYIWRTSFVNDEPGKALGKYVKQQLGTNGSVYLLAPDYAGGQDEIKGFKLTYGEAGYAGEEKTLWPPPQHYDFSQSLAKIKASKAEAVFCFYAGQPAVDFVQQYASANVNKPLYAPGFLTEGAALTAQGASAKNIFTSMNYSADLDNPANRRFTVEYRNAFNTLPTTYAMASYDAAAVLDKAIGFSDEELTPVQLNQLIAKIGQVDSPRGVWRFNQNRTPQQAWYLRQVREDGPVLVNALMTELLLLG